MSSSKTLVSKHHVLTSRGYEICSVNETVKLISMTQWKPRYSIRRTTTGLGFFTLDPIPVDKKIIEYIGPVLTKEEADKKGGKYLMTIDEKSRIDGSARSNRARYINHSCRPNAKAYRTRLRVWIWSIKAIKAGEEITIDYGRNYFEDFIKPVGCKCAECVKKAGKRLTKTSRNKTT